MRCRNRPISFWLSTVSKNFSRSQHRRPGESGWTGANATCPEGVRPPEEEAESIRHVASAPYFLRFLGHNCDGVVRAMHRPECGKLR